MSETRDDDRFTRADEALTDLVEGRIAGAAVLLPG